MISLRAFVALCLLRTINVIRLQAATLASFVTIYFYYSTRQPVLLLLYIHFGPWSLSPAWGRGTPFSSLVHSLPHLQLFLLFPSLIRFTCFLILSTPFLPFLPEQSHSVSRPEVAVGDRTWVQLVAFILFYPYCVVKIHSGVLLYLVQFSLAMRQLSSPAVGASIII